ncbi:MAG: S1 RNA-binding domain-containing protein, partial [Firmicutes bacterium]|nr:S1 RNA-binding domain-containing protein [Bacillota bacterium]
SGQVAKNIVAYREEHGKFRNRKELLKVAKLGPKAYEQCAGFLRISGGDEPLDQTAVHPESYAAAKAMMARTGITGEDIVRGGAAGVEDRIYAAYPGARKSECFERMAKELGLGVPTLRDIVEEFKRPGRDPREDAPPVIFRNDVRSFDDLKVGMELSGTVRNVVDFGAFVDIGVNQDGLVHISQLADRFVKHPMDVVSVGDTVKVRIIGIDREKGKISLSMKKK